MSTFSSHLPMIFFQGQRLRPIGAGSFANGGGSERIDYLLLKCSFSQQMVQMASTTG